MTPNRPCILFFNINGAGLGHMSTCLAYANRLRDHARPVFFSLASAIEMIRDFGFEADYLVSSEWSRAKRWGWDEQVSLRLGMMLERVRPEIIVFDGTWPYTGFLNAAAAYGEAKLVWSNLTLYKPGTRKVPVAESRFDLVLRMGELGSRGAVERAERPGRAVRLPAVTLLTENQLLDRAAAREALGLEHDRPCALLSLGPGNRKDISHIGHGLIEELRKRGFAVAWAQAPISVRDVPLPDDVVPVRVYPLARYMRAFDVFAGAAGYNTCCEVVQSGVPSLLVPNTTVVDDQVERARLLERAGLAVVSACETAAERTDAVERLLVLRGAGVSHRPAAEGQESPAAGGEGCPALNRQNSSQYGPAFELSGAERAAAEILALIGSECTWI